MKTEKKVLNILFIVNPGSGSKNINFAELITEYFSSKEHVFQIHELEPNCDIKNLKAIIKQSNADRIIAVGGDGTLKLVATCVLHTDIPVGIIPAGSANGMARELEIPIDPLQALDVAVEGKPKKIHVTMVNDELCIHLADIGFNAYIVKKFDDLPGRGMWGYTKATWHALWNHHKMEVEFKIENETIRSQAAMVVIANATMYGTGVKINPDGHIDDDVFEVILVKKYSVMEILKVRFTNLPFNPEAIETFKTKTLDIKTKHRAHFQIDGEYMGKVNHIHAKIIPQAIHMIV